MMCSLSTSFEDGSFNGTSVRHGSLERDSLEDGSPEDDSGKDGSLEQDSLEDGSPKTQDHRHDEQRRGRSSPYPTSPSVLDAMSSDSYEGEKEATCIWSDGGEAEGGATGLRPGAWSNWM